MHPKVWAAMLVPAFHADTLNSEVDSATKTELAQSALDLVEKVYQVCECTMPSAICNS